MRTEPGRGPGRAGWLLVVGLVLPGPAAGLEIDLGSQYLSGRFAPRQDSDLAVVSLGLATAGKLRLRVEIPYLNVRVPEAAIITGLGLSPRELRSLNPERLRALVERARQWRSGLGDVRLAVAAGIAGGGSRLYRIDGELEIKAPTADEQLLLGTGEWDLRLGLDGQRRSWSSTVFAGLGWNRLGQPAELRLNDVVDAYCGVESEALRGEVRLSGWLEGSERVSDRVDSRLAVGVGLRGGSRSQWRGGLTVGLTDGAEEIGMKLGVSFNASGERRRRP